MKKTSNHLLLIFTRNPEFGRCKTRLAATIGNQAALDVYKFLLEHTVKITQNLVQEKYVYYSEEIWEEDVWAKDSYKKKLQKGIDLGERMKNAFKDGFKNNFEKIIIIGSDMFDLSEEDLQQAFEKLDSHDFVVGPAEDGGYYLLGMKHLKKELFQNKAWGTGNVLRDTLEDLKDENYTLLKTRNDIDHYEDIKELQAFEPFLKHMKR